LSSESRVTTQDFDCCAVHVPATQGTRSPQRERRALDATPASEGTPGPLGPHPAAHRGDVARPYLVLTFVIGISMPQSDD
jgi:hypothetical protein